MQDPKVVSISPYPEWDVSMPTITPRTRCYHLEPIGVGTPWVESLTGYVARLAKAHYVTPKALIMQEVLPLQGEVVTTSPAYSRLNRFWAKNALSLNGVTTVAREWVDALQTLTGRQDLQFLTMLTWQEVISAQGLLRQSKSWCPQCYQDWQQANEIIYEPLLWALNGVNLCLRHQQPLVTICPSCHTSPPVLSQIARPGYCSHCTHWLGGVIAEDDAQTSISDTDKRKQLLWRAEAVGELLANAAAIPFPPSPPQIAAMLRHFLNLYAGGNVSRFARLLEVTIQNVWSYLQGKSTPQFDSLLQLCFMLHIPPLEFLTGKTLELTSPSSFAADSQPTIDRRRPIRLTAEEKEHMSQTLEEVLAEVGHPVPCLGQIARYLGSKVETLQRHFPDLCQAIIIQRNGRLNRRANPSEIQKVLEEALTSDEIISLWAIAKMLGLAPETLRKYCPDLCQAIVERHRNRFDYTWIQQRLQQALDSYEPIPSLLTLARQVGCPKASLLLRFPNLCRAITNRWRAERRQQHAQEIARICGEVRQAVLTIHQQGRYPSTRQVMKLLSHPQDMRSKEARATWHNMLEALGLQRWH